MNEAHKIWSDTHRTARSQTWDTSDFREGEAFDYYRDAICSAFMPLRPELDSERRGTFQARVVSHQFSGGVLNRVKALSHPVHRGRAEIAASPDECFYMNLQLDGECRIEQGGASIVLRPGEIGLFDGSADFDLDHGAGGCLEVASLMIPKEMLGEDVGGLANGLALKLSSEPTYGSLLCEASGLFASTIGHSDAGGLSWLYSAVLSLAGLAAGSVAGRLVSNNRGDAHFMRIMHHIRHNCATEDYGIAQCAAELGLSAGYIRNLFAKREETFGNFLLTERLKRAARLLAEPASAHLPVYAIAHAAGFREASHFGRAFRKAYDLTPLEWRRKSAKTN
ncbi:helix-turn-helix domain-containing protein [Roseibium sp.]|uniref:helix-turn-helix domain-containing protein n=1 Tax=Roseibium sp. TaxID=1936156 RepID=UPI003D0AE9AA